MFHAKEGFYFGRKEDGSVFVKVADPQDPQETQRWITLKPSEWASVLASVCKRGENGQTFAEAERYHGAE